MAKPKKNKRADKAYLKAVEEIEKDRINEAKVIVKRVLEGIVAAQKQEREAKEKLSLLKQDLDDIRRGKIEKIKERHAKAKEEKKWVPFEAEKLQEIFLNPSSFAFTGTKELSSTATNFPAIGQTATSGFFALSDGSKVSIE